MLGFISRLLVLIGIIMLIYGFSVLYSESLGIEAITGHSEILFTGTAKIGGQSYISLSFVVSDKAKYPYLAVDLTLLSGRDIYLEVYRGEELVSKLRITGSYKGDIELPGPGVYTLRIDNTHSPIEAKSVTGKIVLFEFTPPPEAVSTKLAKISLATGTLALVGAALVYYIGARIARPESVDSMLVELASRKPVALGGPTERAVIELRSKGIGICDLSRLVNVVSKARGVTIEASKGRFSLTYKLIVTGPSDSVTAAVGDILEFCRRTGKCEARPYTSG